MQAKTKISHLQNNLFKTPILGCAYSVALLGHLGDNDWLVRSVMCVCECAHVRVRFKTGFCYVALAVLQLCPATRLALHSKILLSLTPQALD